jgi:serine/threonine protein kinase
VALQLGTRLGPYEIQSAVGAGGMGEVYRATDTNLGRQVAIKVLPDTFAHHPERLARFEREAKTLAALNHPNIAAIYGLERSDGVTALVMEFVEGPTLADRIAQGPIPVDEALSIARQIAEGVEAAHEQSIIHRDLKPANVKVRPDGAVKVLDFGLAKALEPTGVMSPSASRSPTITSPAMTTGVGVLLGTAAYMSPEQARGRPTDRRSDIWAFGCVLYEMLTGQSAFGGGDTVSDAIAAILGRDPEWNTLPGSTPQKVRDLLRRCLRKDPKRRLHDIGDARIEIEDAQSEPPGDAPALQSAFRRRERVVLFAALSLVTLIAAGVGVLALRPPPVAPEMRLEISTPPTTDPASLAISPDGNKIVYVATSEGRSRLWLRSLESVSARPLAGTDDARLPFWSPDSRSVGFAADNKLQRIDISGGSPQTLATVPFYTGGAWSREGVILFGAPQMILRIPATGGEATPATRVEAPQQQLHGFPSFLPDGRHFLYHVWGSPEARGVYIGQLDESQAVRLLDADPPAVYASSGHLLFARQGTLYAQLFDPVGPALTGDPFPVAERVTVSVVSGISAAPLSASAAGPLVYRSGSPVQQQFVWVDRSGKRIEEVGGPGSLGAEGGTSSLSPDGRRVALVRSVDANVDVWLLELGRNVPSRFTTDAALDMLPIWSPDGTRIVFSSSRKGGFDLYEKPAAGAGSERPLLTTAQDEFATDWSPDGRFLLYMSSDDKGNSDIWALPRDGKEEPFPLVQTNFVETFAQFSPDGKWIAYESNQTGRFEIYVQPFPGPGAPLLISTNGGAQARWRRDGKELFYVALDNRLLAVPIRLAATGAAVEAPVPLFPMRIIGSVQGDIRYMVASDGQRFLMNTVTDEAASPITVILNWKPKP